MIIFIVIIMWIFGLTYRRTYVRGLTFYSICHVNNALYKIRYLEHFVGKSVEYVSYAVNVIVFHPFILYLVTLKNEHKCQL